MGVGLSTEGGGGGAGELPYEKVGEMLVGNFCVDPQEVLIRALFKLFSMLQCYCLMFSTLSCIRTRDFDL